MVKASGLREGAMNKPGPAPDHEASPPSCDRSLGMVCAAIRRIASALALTPILTSCASYTPQPMPLLRLEGAAASTEASGVALGATLFLDAARSTQIFGEDLTRKGVLAVQVVVRNQGQDRLAIGRESFVLRLAEGAVQSPASAMQVAERLERDVAVLGWTLGFGLTGHYVSSVSQGQHTEANAARAGDLQRKEFPGRILGPRESAQGFLFFLVPEKVTAPAGAVLSVTAERSAGAAVTVHLTLRDTEPGSRRHGREP